MIKEWVNNKRRFVGADWFLFYMVLQLAFSWLQRGMNGMEMLDM
jgi:hypothetical protein